jgi:CubicO group peptidase (beta-lactamase class C family)/D-alanyl-D-alanine dipeptidase
MWRSMLLGMAMMPVVAMAADRAEPVWARAGEAALVAIQQEQAARTIPSIIVGIVTRDGLVWSGGAGYADAEGRAAVDANTIYRIGGITQALTAELLRTLASRGMVDIDAPVDRYLPSFQPRNTFGGTITLRQLLEHRSGLVRSPPKGSHFDPHRVTLADTVTSLNATALVAPPGSAYKYSEAGYAVLARVLEVVAGKPFEQLLAEEILIPKGMMRTFLQAAAPTAYAVVAPFDGERFAAPLFDMGVAPAIGAYASLNDLARFAQGLLEGEPSAPGGEFVRDQLDGHDMASISGGVYGFSNDLSLFPAAGFAVITLVAIDSAEPVVRRLRDVTARHVFTARANQRKPALDTFSRVPVGLAHRMQGHYSDGARSLDLRIVDQRLFLEAPEVVGEVRQRDGRLVLDDLTVSGDEVQFDSKVSSVTFRGVTYARTAWQRPPAASEELAGLVGEYGWPHNIVRIYERDGEPYARVEWARHYKLERVAKDVYRFPATGAYASEMLHFMRNEHGVAMAMSLSGIILSRRDLGAETEAVSRSNSPFIAELLASARTMSPPVQSGRFRKPDLVEVHKLESGMKLDVRYATANNFMGAPFYDEPRFFLQRPAANALIRAHRKLAEHGFGIVLLDGYRPWYVTRMFYDAVPPESRPFVADPAQGSRHNRGCAADITMFDLATGEIVEMPGRYDEPSSRSSPLYLGGTSLQRWHRDLLKQAVEAEGFDVYINEWWHFDFGDWRQYPVMNVDFAKIEMIERQAEPAAEAIP